MSAVLSLPMRIVSGVAMTLLTGAACVFGYRLVRADLEANVYKQRLSTLVSDYETLRKSYNDAVRRTAVTEVIVKDEKLSLRVRGQSGVLRDIPTSFDPRGEIYFDFAVVDGRLWIRRVFDSKTPPDKGLVLEPELANVNWDDPSASHGKAVYRTLGEGRWVVSVSGDGSLGLARAKGDVEIASGPAIKDHSELEAEARKSADAIGPREVWDWLFGGR